MNIQEKVLEPQLIVGIRVKAKYEEMGKYILELINEFGEYIVGPPFTLYYDQGFQEIADYEMCFNISKKIEKEGFSTREIEGGKCISLLHYGGYDKSMESWKLAFNYITENNLEVLMPSREYYLVGPNTEEDPNKYITEIQVLIK